MMRAEMRTSILTTQERAGWSAGAELNDKHSR